MSGKRYPEGSKVETVRQTVERSHFVHSIAKRLGITTKVFTLS